MVSEEERPSWEATNLGGCSYKSVPECSTGIATSSRPGHQSSSPCEHAPQRARNHHRTLNQRATAEIPLFEPTTSGVRKQKSEAQACNRPDLAPGEQQKSGRHLIRTRKRGRRTRTSVERALHGPDTRHGSVEVVGGHQRSHYRQLCLRARSLLPSSKPPESVTAINKLRASQPELDPGSRTQKRRQSPRPTGEARIWNPGPQNLTKNHVKVPTEKSHVTRRDQAQTRRQRRPGTDSAPIRLT